MLHRLAAVACVALLAGAATGRADDKVNETLRRYFPDRDLTRAAVKIVDHANGIIAVGDALAVTKDGHVRTTNAIVI